MTAGCAPTLVKDPVSPTVANIKDPASAQLKFWHDLPSRRLVCNDDAFHGLLLFFEQKDTNTSYADRLAELKSKKLIPPGFNGAADEAVSRGTVAYAVVQELHIRGGLMLTVLGPTPRYALRELMDLNLFPRSSPEQTLSGSDFVGTLGRIEDYQDGESAFIPAQSLRPPTAGD